MLTDKLEQNFEHNEPIFKAEIRMLYPEVPYASLCRQIHEEEIYGSLRRYLRGVYYLVNPSGDCGINADDVIHKKFIGWGDRTYGTLTGYSLRKEFGLGETESMDEIVSNNETTRGRMVYVQDKKFFVKKSRCEITAENVHAYMVVELCNNLTEADICDAAFEDKVLQFIRDHNVSRDQILEVSSHFTTRPVKNLIACGIMQQIA